MSEPRTVAKSWTLQQVLELSEERRKDGDPDHLRPLLQWEALFRLDDLERAYADGDDGALFEAIYHCSLNDLVVPRWAAQAFINGYRKVTLHEAATWDDAFGRATPKGKHLAEARERLRLKPEVYLRTKALIGEGAAVDDGLFEQVGEEFGIGKTLAKRLYYDFKAQSEALLAPGSLVHSLLAPLLPRRTGIVRNFPQKRKS